MEGIDFHPKVLKKSDRIVRSKEAALERDSIRSAASAHSAGRSNSGRRSNGKFESLYADAKRRNERKDNIYSACLDAECTFQPDLHATKKRFSNSDGYKNGRAERSEIFERLSQGVNSSRERSQLMLANS